MSLKIPSDLYRKISSEDTNPATGMVLNPKDSGIKDKIRRLNREKLLVTPVSPITRGFVPTAIDKYLKVHEEGMGTALLSDGSIPDKVVKTHTCEGMASLIGDEGKLLYHLHTQDRNGEFVPELYSLFKFRDGSKGICMEKLGPDIYGAVTSQGKRWKLDDPRLFQICEIILFYHENGLLYGDIKPNNFGFVRSRVDKVKGFDFDASQLVLPHETCSVTITPRPYRSPEVILKNPYTTKTDVFSLGCLLFELYAGELFVDWNGRHRSESEEEESSYNLIHLHVLFKRLKTYPMRPFINRASFWDYFEYSPQNYFSYNPFYSLIRLKKLSEEVSINSEYFVDTLNRKFAEDGVSDQKGKEFIHLLKKMLEMDPSKRISMEEVVKHPFFARHTSKNKATVTTEVPEPRRKKLKTKH